MSNFKKFRINEKGAISSCIEIKDESFNKCLPIVLDTGDPHIFIFDENIRKSHSATLDSLVKIDFIDMDSLTLTFNNNRLLENKASDGVKYDPRFVFFSKNNNLGRDSFVNSGYFPFLKYDIYFDAENNIVAIGNRK